MIADHLAGYTMYMLSLHYLSERIVLFGNTVPASLFGGEVMGRMWVFSLI